jgi:hypothetical protein
MGCDGGEGTLQEDANTIPNGGNVKEPGCTVRADAEKRLGKSGQECPRAEVRRYLKVEDIAQILALLEFRRLG